MRFTIGSLAELPDASLEALDDYRHGVFVERLGWQLQTPAHRERDDFDRLDTVYVIAHGKHGRVVGCARLLPTTRPYLLSHVFPQLLDGLEPPCSSRVWELSRFASLDLENDGRGGLGFQSSPEAVALLRAAIRCAHELGATALITVSPVGVERLLRNAGFEAERLGVPRQVGEHRLFACRIAVRELSGSATAQIARVKAEASLP